jgi:hypothetical protein
MLHPLRAGQIEIMNNGLSLDAASSHPPRVITAAKYERLAAIDDSKVLPRGVVQRPSKF